MEEKRRKKTKLYTFILVLSLSFLTFLYFTNRPYNYKREYKVNKYEVEESYDKKKGYYTFLIKDNNVVYSYLIKNNYTRRRELINNIKEYKENDNKCIYPESNKVSFYPLCQNKDGEVIAYSINDFLIKDYKLEKVKEKNKEYEKLSLNYLNNKNYLLFNYRGFYYLNDDTMKKIELFSKDIYNLSLVYQMDNYVVVPDYNEDHYFNKIYIINLKNGKLEEINLENAISFNSVFLGDYKNKIYLLDKKEEKEYRLNISKKKIEEVEFSILENNKMVKKEFKEIVNKNLNFLKEDYPLYKINDKNLYKYVDNYNVKLSNLEVSNIVKIVDDNIYYLSEDKLMLYNPRVGEVNLITNFEWNFNYTNMIFIF